MSARDYSIRYTNKTQGEYSESMRYPYMYVNDEYQEHYSLENILRPIVVEVEGAEVGDFPKNIQEHFWVRSGENDGDSWLSCGQLTNGSFFYYTGSCDFTGFDCHGGMNLWVSSTWKNIVDNAMSQAEYELYMASTEEQEEEHHICCHCGEDEGTMPNEFTEEGEHLCADCFWDMDAEMKHERRADPTWVAGRAYSAAKVLLGKTEEEAQKVAAQVYAKLTQ